MQPPPLKVDLRQDRDFGEVFNATFVFLRQNASALVRGVLFFVAPAVVVSQLLVGSSAQSFWNLSEQAAADPAVLFASLPSLLAGMAFAVVAWLAHQLVVLGTVKLHEEVGPGRFEPLDALKAGLQYFWPLLGVTLLMGLFFVVTAPLHLLICVGTAGVVYVATRLSLASYAVVMDGQPLVEAFRVSWALVNREWWQTFGVLFVMYVIAGILGYVFQIPMLVYSAVTALATAEAGALPGELPLWLMALNVVAQIAQYLLYTLPLVAGALQYGNLSEARFQTSLVDRVRTFGASPAAGEGGA